MKEVTIKVNIDDYLSEQEKRDLVIEVFKTRVEKELFKEYKGTVQSDAEVQRIIGNISYEIVTQEIQKYIPDYEKMIKDKVAEIMKSRDFGYEVFRRKDAWGGDDSLAIKYINTFINESKTELSERVKQEIKNFDISNTIREEVIELFNQAASNLYALADIMEKNNTTK